MSETDGADLVASMMDMITMLSESAGGMRASLISSGFSEPIAEAMAANYYTMLLTKIADEE